MLIFESSLAALNANVVNDLCRFYGAKQVLWNSKVWIAALCCDVAHSLTAFGSYTFSPSERLQYIEFYRQTFFGTDIEMKLNPFKTGAVKLFWIKSPKSQGLFFEMVWCIITIYILWCLSASSARELESEAVVQQLNSTHVNFDHVQSELTGLLIQFRAISMGRFHFFLLVDHQITVTNTGNSSIMEWSPDNAGNQ